MVTFEGLERPVSGERGESLSDYENPLDDVPTNTLDDMPASVFDDIPREAFYSRPNNLNLCFLTIYSTICLTRLC